MGSEAAKELAERRVGATLREKYRIERVLGVGGMATVYLGVHRNGHRVAVKILHPELAAIPGQRDRFVREGYVANSIEHPGAVRVIDDDVAEDGCPFLVMELLDGQTLDERRRRQGGKLLPRDVLAIGHALCDVLAAAHDKGVIHRDIKPENVFITSDGALKVLDFGIARIITDEGIAGVAGTPAFMPPEQALGDRGAVDARADLWAAGATMFTLLTGRLVHEASRTTQLLAFAATKSAPSLVDVAPELPPELAAIVDTALAYNRDDRFEDAREMRDAISTAYTVLFDEPLSVVAPRGPVHSIRPSLPSNSGPLSSPQGPPSQALSQRSKRAEAQLIETLADEPLPGEGSPKPPSLAPAAAPIAGGPPSTAPPRNPHVLPHPRPRSRVLAAGIAGLSGVLVLFAIFVGRERRHNAATLDEAQAHAAPTAVGSCKTNAECIAESGGKPAMCRKDRGQCVALESAECHVLADKGDVENDATFWIGAMYPQRDKGYGQQAALSVELARRDFAGLTGGLPPLPPSTKPRPIGVVLCDDSEAPERSATHLVDQVGVPVILGFARSKEVLDLARSEFLPKGVLALASNTASMLADIATEKGEPRLVFRVTTSADMVHAPRAVLIERVLEPLIRKNPAALRPDEPLRLAIVRADNASGMSHADRLLSALHFGTKNATSHGEAVRQFVMKDQLTKNDLPAELATMGESIAAFSPHVVIAMGVNGGIFLSIEQRWSNRALFRPFYMFEGTTNEEELALLVQKFPTTRTRALGVDMATSPTVAKFVVHFNETFPEKIKPFEANAAPYDAFFVAAYAAIALGEERITGKSLARAIGRLLPPGDPIEVGPSGIYPAIKALRSGKNIDLVGAQTSLDFNPETGDPTVDMAVFRFDPKRKSTLEAGLVYRAKTGTLEGTLQLP